MADEMLSLKNISFSYGKNKIISNFSLDIERGSFTSLLGPSGCGKTTLLRIIAGFLKPSSGRIIMNNHDITELPVEKRHIGIVFQDYALFPHLTVFENLMFGFSRNERKNHLADLKETCDSLEINSLLARYPHELSGGQQQRVALGRSLMMKPEVILMDEPLSSLDANLRIKVREELLEIQKKIGITTVYVTHDQEEALSLSSKIAVLKEGHLLQYETPLNIYFSPACKDVADLTGMTNYIKINGKMMLVRPNWIELNPREKFYQNESNLLEGTILSSVFTGNVIRYRIALDQAENKVITVDSSAFGILQNGQKVKLNVINTCPIFPDIY